MPLTPPFADAASIASVKQCQGLPCHAGCQVEDLGGRATGPFFV
jgi:hypothetical protein